MNGLRYCLRIVLFAAILISGNYTVSAQSAGANQGAQMEITSPRLTTLSHELDEGSTTALPAFWQEIEDKAPLVETIPGDTQHRLVTFLWRGDDKTTSVSLCGGLPSPSLAKPLIRLGKTDLWYISETYPTQARFEYFFGVNLPSKLPLNEMDQLNLLSQYPPLTDPLNSHVFNGRSYLELPDAPPQPWIIRHPGTPQGKTSQIPFKSHILNAEYSLNVYTPPGYAKKGAPCWLMIAFDGGFPMMEETLDNLKAAGKIPPMVVVGVNNLSGESRNRDLAGSEPFARFLATELVPWAREHYHLYGDAAHTLVGGVSLGGFMAVYCGLTHSDVFGKVIAQSPTLIIAPGQSVPASIWDEESPGLLAHRFVNSPRLPLTFYLEAGRYETFFSFSMLGEARRLRDVLEAKGYPVTYHENVGGHNAVCWRGELANALIALTSESHSH